MLINSLDCRDKIPDRKVTVVVLAGGRGTRLAEVTDGRPKAVMPVRGVSIIRRIINRLPSSVVERLVVVTGFAESQIRQELSELRPGFRIDFSHDSELTGTCNAVKNAITEMSSELDHDLLILNGDTICKIDLRKYIEDYFKCNRPLTSVGFESLDKRYGPIPNHFLKRSLDCKSLDLRNAGYYLAPLGTIRDMYAEAAQLSMIGFEELWFFSSSRYHLVAEIQKSDFIDIGTISDFALAQTLEWT
jgi:NDP-sugar pyrophosphorylase family protein